MTKATSFIGEHTAEFVLVPIIKQILHKQFEFVTPIFPWMTREGSDIAKDILQNEEFKILGLYPRRPKIVILDKTSYHITINEQVIKGAQSGLKLGIPVIAGYPFVKNFWDLGKTPNCLWIRLDFKSCDNLEFQIKSEVPFNCDTDLINMIFKKESEIIEYFNANSKVFNFETAMDAFRKIKIDSMNLNFNSFFAFLGGYKPIYFLLK